MVLCLMLYYNNVIWYYIICKNVITISVRMFYHIIGEVITLLGFITFSIELCAHFITFSGVITFSGYPYIIGCYREKHPEETEEQEETHKGMVSIPYITITYT